MMKSACLVIAVILLAGCAAPRYQIAVAPVDPSASGNRPGTQWVAVRVDQKTGTSWYARDEANTSDIRWHPVPESNETKK